MSNKFIFFKLSRSQYFACESEWATTDRRTRVALENPCGQRAMSRLGWFAGEWS
jgi:hypothetical protein